MTAAKERRRARRHPGWSVVIGEFLIVVGALYLLFVLWEQVWTTAEYTASLDEMNAEISEGWEAERSAASSENTTAPEILPTVPEPATSGEIFARMWVPRFGDDAVPIAQGIERDPVLDQIGIGHYPGAAMPGEVGNFAVAGHRTSYGKPFRHIAELRDGDPLIVETAEYWYVYSYTGSAIVPPSAVETIAPVPNSPGETPSEAVITLTACHPLYSRAERWVAWGEFSYGLPKSAGTPAELGTTLSEQAGAQR